MQSTRPWHSTACPRGLLHALGYETTREKLPSLAIVAAHADDEVIGAGGQLSRWSGAQIVHVTDGAPKNMADAVAGGFSTRQEYAAARRRELESALRLAGLTEGCIHNLGFVDQESCRELARLSLAVKGLLIKLGCRVVMTHPYEGGHPDHDATAFAVHAACSLIEREGARAPVVVEMTSYFNCAGMMVTGEFLHPQASPKIVLELNEEQRRFKRQMLACFVTQQKTVKVFGVNTEGFRLAPAYDFTQAPHEGTLYYEMFDWGTTGSEWRKLSTEALEGWGLTNSELVSGWLQSRLHSESLTAP